MLHIQSKLAYRLPRKMFWCAFPEVKIVSAFGLRPESKELFVAHPTIRHLKDGFGATKVEEDAGEIESEGANLHRRVLLGCRHWSRSG